MLRTLFSCIFPVLMLGCRKDTSCGCDGPPDSTVTNTRARLQTDDNRTWYLLTVEGRIQTRLDICNPDVLQDFTAGQHVAVSGTLYTSCRKPENNTGSPVFFSVMIGEIRPD